MSQTIIDSLVVKLGLDAKDLNNQAPGGTAKLRDLEKQADTTESAFVDLTKSLGAFLALLGGTAAIKAFITDTVTANAALGRFAKNLDLSVETISAWGNAVETVGGSSKSLQGTLDMLSKAQTELRLTGQSGLIPYFSALNINLGAFGEKARPVTEILLDLANRFQGMDRQQANNLGRMIGIDQDTLNLLLQGRSAVELLIKRQKESNVVTKAQAEEAARLQQRQVELRQGFEALGRSLLEQATPALEKVLGFFQRIGDWAKENKEFVSEFLTVVAVGLGAIAVAALPLTGTVAAITALAAAIVLVAQDYQTWKKGGDSFIDWEKWEPGILQAIDKLTQLRDLMERIYKIEKALITIEIPTDFKSLNLPGKTDAFLKKLGIDTKGWGNARTSGSAIFGQGLPSNITGAQAKAYFMSRGMSDAEASGLAAQIVAESSGKSGAIGDGGAAYGLLQWHKDRQENFRKFTGHDIQGSSTDEQLAFIMHELISTESGAGNKLKGAGDARTAGELASRYYVRPADADGEAARRGSAAALLAGIGGASSTIAAAGGATAGGSSSPTTVDASKTVGTINVYTSATDLIGIAADMDKSLDYLFTSQGNTGLPY